MPEEQEPVPPPVLLAVIICDQVIIDAISQKASIIGAFENISAVKYPARHARLAFFCQLTNGRGKTKISISLVDVEKEDEQIFQQTVEPEFKDVRQVRNLTFNIGGIVFPRPGEYRFQVHAGTEFLGERRIICRQIEPPVGREGNGR
ncbi:MAG: DUF6941 family protein [Planctomycetota bacterium]